MGIYLSGAAKLEGVPKEPCIVFQKQDGHQEFYRDWNLSWRNNPMGQRTFYTRRNHRSLR